MYIQYRHKYVPCSLHAHVHKFWFTIENINIEENVKQREKRIIRKFVNINFYIYFTIQKYAFSIINCESHTRAREVKIE